MSQRSIPDLLASGCHLTEDDFLQNDMKHMRLETQADFSAIRRSDAVDATYVHPKTESPRDDDTWSYASSCSWCEDESIEEQELDIGRVALPTEIAFKLNRCKHFTGALITPPPPTTPIATD